MKKLIRLVVLLLLFVGLNKLALAEDKPSIACLAGKAELIGRCLDEVYTKWDKKLNDTYKSVMGYLSKDKKTELRNQQRIWLKERAKKCDGLSSEHAIKACHLDEAQLKVLALEDQEADLMPKTFEGDWSSSPEEGEGLSSYVQQGDIICGIEQSHKPSVYRNVKLKRIDMSLAKVLKSFDCRYESDCNNINIEDGEDGEDGIEYDGEAYKDSYIRVCNNRLYQWSGQVKDRVCKNDENEIIQQGDNIYKNGFYLIKENESVGDRMLFIKDNPWINKCLN